MSHPFTHHPRHSLTPQQRARIFAEHDGCCHRCGRKIGVSDYWEVEHPIALENGGADTPENRKPCCEWCLPDKNAEDHSLAAKGRARYVRHVVPREFRKSRTWRRD